MNSRVNAGGNIEILSDTGGVDFAPYIGRMRVLVQDHWYPLIPAAALAPELKSGTVTIEFAILKNGDVRELRITESSADEALDRAAFGAIASSRPLPSLPAEFPFESLRLRCRFLYNPDKSTYDNALLSEKQSRLYTQALAEIKGENWGNAERLIEQIVQVNPNYAPAWNNLGRARMHLGKYAEAEPAFQKLVELKPNDSLSYAQLAWALTSEKKYLEAVQLLEKRTAAAPNDAEAFRRLGFSYLRMQRPEPAVRAFEEFLRLHPGDEFVNYNLGTAYLQVNRNNDAVAAFERFIAIKRSESKLNDAAYELSKYKAGLEVAEGWATSAVTEIETELNQTNLQTAQVTTATLLRRASMYWDTLGWIRFQKQDLRSAEKYILAAWELADSAAISTHLGRVYEAQGRKSEAIEVYAELLAMVPGNRERSDDEKEARSRLAALLGGEPMVDARVDESRPRLKERRSIEISNPGGLQGTIDYLVMLGPESTVANLQVIGNDPQLEKMNDIIRATKMPQSFPDASTFRLPRAATLTCLTPKTCKFALLSAGNSARSFSSLPGTEP